ncbi:hypothetical protein [Tardiphaga sp.]|nr:hypothetical protein [Tardiphaga sp.]MBC7576953.1 hypothetical protein [Tardiphaga sp.]
MVQIAPERRVGASLPGPPCGFVIRIADCGKLRTKKRTITLIGQHFSV